MASRIGIKASQRAPESTSLDAERSPKAQLIGQVLDTLRFHGWTFCISDLRAPWAFKLPGDRLAALHAVLEGECVVHLAGQKDYARLVAGDIVLLPRDNVHAVADVRAEQLFQLRQWLQLTGVTVSRRPLPTTAEERVRAC
jgi:hypothetical protein